MKKNNISIILIVFLSLILNFNKTNAEGTKQIEPLTVSTNNMCNLVLYRQQGSLCDTFGFYTADSNHIINFRIKSTNEKR